jgi:hypothetical protein
MILRSDPSRIPPGQLTFEEHFGDLVSEWSNFKPREYEYAYSWWVILSFGRSCSLWVCILGL